MKQRLVYILKHNMLVQKLYKWCMSLVFRFLGLFVSTDENLVLFSSFMGSKFNDSPKAIYDMMRADAKYGKYNCVWAFEHPENFPELKTVKIDTLKYFMTALKAKYWITNTNIERGLSFKKKNTVYLNTWHGIALKKIGNDCPGRNDYNFDTLNYLCVSGEHDEQVFRTAFRAREKSYLKCGMPRNDELWNVKPGEKEALREKLGIDRDKIVILYAPTWRDSVDGGKSYAIKPPIDFSKWKEKLGEDYVILFRAHHITTKVLDVQFDDFIRDASNYPNVNELMIASDMLITDYSAIAFDYSILCRPILCYAYDYDTYLSDRGTYFDIDEKYPNKSCREEDELLDTIIGLDFDEQSEKTREFRDYFLQYHDNATENCLKSLFGEK
ncbi:MAG: CDP-glycerol glycerophosphotransferase family protein [Clostridia bacterium]|nr:CDP-glycerol glycerophosphotransferase family protein [Clostridia bacterium]